MWKKLIAINIMILTSFTLRGCITNWINPPTFEEIFPHAFGTYHYVGFNFSNERKTSRCEGIEPEDIFGVELTYFGDNVNIIYECLIGILSFTGRDIDVTEERVKFLLGERTYDVENMLYGSYFSFLFDNGDVPLDENLPTVILTSGYHSFRSSTEKVANFDIFFKFSFEINNVVETIAFAICFECSF
jgi:hypothetical protein